MTFGVGQATTTFTANLSAVGTTALTCASALFLNTMLGNVINIAGQGFYCITGFTSSTVVTVDRALGTFTLATGVVGGALLSPALVESVVVAGNTVNYLQGTYTISSTTANVAGGRLNLNVSGTGLLRIHRAGYAVTHGDLGTKPIFQIASSGVTSITVVTFNNANSYNSIENVTIDGNSKSNITAMDVNGRENLALRIKCQNCSNISAACVLVSNNAYIAFIELTGCTSGASGGITLNSNGTNALFCVVQNHSGIAFRGAGSGIASFCIASTVSDNTNGYGFKSDAAVDFVCNNCIAYSCAKDGFYAGGTNNGLICNNCIASNNTGIGFNSLAATANLWLFNCAGFNNTGGDINTGTSAPFRNENFVTLGSVTSPFIAAGTNFGLTNAAIALLGSQGIPGAMPGLASSVGKLCIGTIQPATSLAGDESSVMMMSGGSEWNCPVFIGG